MKTTIVISSLLTAIVALAAPASAECADIADGEAWACAFVDDPAAQFVGAGVNAVANAGYSYDEFSIFGQTYKSTYLYAATPEESPAGANYLAFNEFCMGSGDTCNYRDDTLVYSGAAGYAYVGLWQGSEARALCYVVADEYGCQEF